jgi:predicted O-methyltransferase YrrM
MELINPLAEAYAERFSTPVDPLLDELYTSTLQHHSHANMMSSRLQGKFLEIFSILHQPSRILEVGTFIGFSALCMAKGLKEGGKLHTIELRDEDAATAKSYFDRSNVRNNIILHIGNALNVLAELHETWDLVFIDADKTGYLEYYKLILPMVRKGGVILADNVLFHGEVLTEPVKGKNAVAIHDFNEYVAQDERVEQVMIPMRDGLFLIRKK